MSASFEQPAHFLGAVALAALPWVLPLTASASDMQEMSADYMDHGDHHPASHGGYSPLVRKVHDAIEKYEDINFALKKEKQLGWVIATTCVSGPEAGAMGIHVVSPSRTTDGIVAATEPEALIYEPLPNGYYRLVGAEFIQDKADWDVRNPDGPPPSLEGNLMNLVDYPNRYGLQAFYEIHVWAMEDNPKGSFADWNTHVTCEKQPGVR